MLGSGRRNGRCSKTTIEYLKTRQQFGVNIGTFQALQHRGSDMFVALEQARGISMYATMAVGFDDPKARTDAIAAAKVQVGRSAKISASSRSSCTAASA